MSTGCRAIWSTGRRATSPSAPIRHLLPEEAGRRWLYFKLWPNVAIDIYPDQVDFMHFVPVGPTETMIREISYALPDARREMKAARYLNWRINRQVNAEDTALIRRVQQGMASSSTGRGRSGGARSACGASRRSSGGSFRRRGWSRRRRPAGAACPAHDQIDRQRRSAVMPRLHRLASIPAP